MKEAIGGTWLFTIVIIMIALFTGYICLSTNYSRSYKMKDRIIEIIQKEGGVTTNAKNEINQMLNKSGYASKGLCPSKSSACWIGYDKSSNRFRKATGTNMYSYCIARTDVSKAYTDDAHSATLSSSGTHYTVTSSGAGLFASAYYSVTVFFTLDLPVFNQLFNIRVSGETSSIVTPTDTDTYFKSAYGSCS